MRFDVPERFTYRVHSELVLSRLPFEGDYARSPKLRLIEIAAGSAHGEGLFSAGDAPREGAVAISWRHAKSPSDPAQPPFTVLVPLLQAVPLGEPGFAALSGSGSGGVRVHCLRDQADYGYRSGDA